MIHLSLDRKKVFQRLGILPKQLAYILRLYLSGILCFTVFRLILFAQEFHQLHYLPTDKGAILVLKAFLMGLRFDTVVTGYILAGPFLILCVDAFAGWNSRFIYRLVFWLVTSAFFFSFFVCAVDLPNFHHFYTRITMAVLISAHSGSSNLLSGMVFEEWRYYWVLLPLGIISWFFFRSHRALLNGILLKRNDFPVVSALWSFPVFALLLFMGIWNRFSLQTHIDAGTAYFSDYGFTNMLGLNSVYTFGLSFVNSIDNPKQEVRFMGDGEAVRNVQEYLQIPAAQEFDSPIARQIIPDTSLQSSVGSLQSPNVVLVIMESMSAAKMGRYGNSHSLTPFMDSLASQGYSFDSAFTAGVHTFAGIYSTLFSQPVIKRQHPLMKIDRQSGIANSLKQHGYSTVYFTTHDDEFDNVGPFLRENGYDRVVSMSDYPKEKVLSALGVPDDYLYEHAVADLDNLHRENRQPFFAAIMTGSDHSPYVIPKYFKPKNKDATLAIVEYVDWSVRKFMHQAAQKDWFKNTLFVFVADHGASLDKRYDMSLSFLHTPLIFYAPQLLDAPSHFSTLTAQVDIFPTVMGVLKLPYVNNTFGIDVLHENRTYTCAYADDKFAVLNSEYLFVSRENGISSLYRYKTGDMKNYLEAKPELAEKMKTYGESIFQAAQWLRKEGKTEMQNQ